VIVNLPDKARPRGDPQSPHPERTARERRELTGACRCNAGILGGRPEEPGQ
jgi:hypothetical protein